MQNGYKMLTPKMDKNYMIYFCSGVPGGFPTYWDREADGNIFGAEAQCGLDQIHIAPSEICSCGIYTMDNLEDVDTQGYTDRGIVFHVGLWGRIIQGEVGKRSQYAGLFGMMPKMCGVCTEVATNVVAAESQSFEMFKFAYRCKDHSENKVTFGGYVKNTYIVSFESLAKKYNVPIYWERYTEIIQEEKTKEYRRMKFRLSHHTFLFSKTFSSVEDFMKNHDGPSPMPTEEGSLLNRRDALSSYENIK